MARLSALKPGQLRATHYKTSPGAEWVALSNGPIFYRSNLDALGGGSVLVNGKPITTKYLRLVGSDGAAYEFAAGKWVGTAPTAPPAPVVKVPMTFETALKAKGLTNVDEWALMRAGWDLAQWAGKQ
jgi:hypothetical protein